MNSLRVCVVFLLSLSSVGCNRDATPPLQIAFKPAGGLTGEDRASLCSVPAGRDRAFDPNTGIHHVHFQSRDFSYSAFEITEVSQKLSAPIKFRFTGDTKGAGCLGQDLTFTVDGKNYDIEKSDLGYGNYDPQLFHVSRSAAAVDVEFTHKAVALLKPGATVWLRVDTGW